MQFRTEKKKKRPFILLMLAAALPALILGGYLGSVQFIQSQGIWLTPSSDYPVQDALRYLQNDPLWSAEPLGNSGLTLGSAGSAVACAASAVSQLSRDVTPAELNRRLTAAEAWRDAEMDWKKLRAAIPDVDCRLRRIFSGRAIDRDLQAGLLPAVKVRHPGDGAEHWVLIAGAGGGEYLVLDPLCIDQTPTPLSQYGKVYACRTVTSAD